MHRCRRSTREEENLYSQGLRFTPYIRNCNQTLFICGSVSALKRDLCQNICVNETAQIDIRRYLSGKPGNEGIILTKIQWQYLKASIDHIDESILKVQKSI